MKIWRGLAALAVWTGVLLQLWLMIHGRPAPEVAAALVKFFSFFTILSNIVVGVILTAPVLWRERALGRWAERAGTRVAGGVYIAITAVVYHGLLAGTWNPQGLQLLADTLLHTITPLLFLADILAFPPREAARWGSAWKALVFPLLYGAWTLLHGAMSAYYPYPFFNVTQRGYGAVLATMVVMGAGFYAVTLLLTGLQHLQLRLASRRMRSISA
ncbi:MAG: Pr6Pr family membrane protein [Caulobacter sp.]|nr:Pr6Pr family membrane protein [Caulobacter sp.]